MFPKVSLLRLRGQLSSSAAPSRLFEREETSRSCLSLLFPLVLSGTLFVLSKAENPSVRHLEILLADMSMPLIEGTTHFINRLTGVVDFFQSQSSLHREIFALKEQNTYLLAQKLHHNQLAQDVNALKALARFVQEAPYQRISASLIGKTDDGYSTNFFVKATAHDGVTKNDPVMDAQGVLGRILEISLTGARVLPITDSASRIPIQTQSGIQAVVSGRNLPFCHKDCLEVRHLESVAQIKVGDHLYTSGHGGIFPRGLPVAVVTSIEGSQVFAKPFAQSPAGVVSIILSKAL